MEIDLNEIIISGTINNVTDNNKDYIKFGLTTLKYDKRKVYSSLNINRNLYTIYKDFFVYKEFSLYEEHKRSEQMLTPKIIHNI